MAKNLAVPPQPEILEKYGIHIDPPLASKPRTLEKKARVLSALCVILAVVAVLFICLYVAAVQQFENSCRDVFSQSVSNAVSLMDECLQSDYDYETKYREVVAELNSAREMLFLTNAPKEQQICMNEIYFASVKLPNQVRLKMTDIREGLAYLTQKQESQGFSLLQTVVADLDRQDY